MFSLNYYYVYIQVTSRCRIQSDLSVFNSRKMCGRNGFPFQTHLTQK